MAEYKKERIYFNRKDGVEMFLITWPPGSETRYHDHKESFGVIVALGGEVFERQYSKKTKRLLQKGVLKRDDITLELPSRIQKMGNASKTQSAQTLHIFFNAPMRMTFYDDAEFHPRRG